MILALTPEKEVVMVRQYRHGTEQVCLELPGGLVEPVRGRLDRKEALAGSPIESHHR